MRSLEFHNRYMYSFISDVHIQKSKDPSSDLFVEFLQHPLVKSSKKVFLLGDIFDLMVGEKNGHLNNFTYEFEQIKTHLGRNESEVVFLEGNHDFHLKHLFEDYFQGINFSYATAPIIESIDNVRYLFCHGDEIELENPSYKRYRRIIKSKVIKFLANKIVPYSLIKKYGEKASQTSRKYSSNYVNDIVQDKFIRSAMAAAKHFNVRTVVCGHSHISESLQTQEGDYFNNGFFPTTKTFTHFDGKNFNLVKL